MLPEWMSTGQTPDWVRADQARAARKGERCVQLARMCQDGMLSADEIDRWYDQHVRPL